MAKSEVDEVTEKTVKQGGILVKMYFDMQSEKQDDLQPLMVDLINNQLLKAPGVVYCFGSVDSPIKLDNMYSTTASVTALFKDLGALINVTFNFTPAVIEILKPTNEYVLKTSYMQSMLLDIAKVSLDYAQFIMDKVMNPEDKQKLMDHMKRREELGRRMLEKKDEKKEGQG